jgi:hypothetical protein
VLLLFRNSPELAEVAKVLGISWDPVFVRELTHLKVAAFADWQIIKINSLSNLIALFTLLIERQRLILPELHATL